MQSAMEQQYSPKLKLVFIIRILLFLFPLINRSTAAIFSYNVHCHGGTNYTRQKTPFQTNLVSVFSLFNSTSSATYFRSATAGSAPDKVYAAFTCRYNLPFPTCQDCVATATAGLLAYCPGYWEAAALYPLCAVQYSNQSLFSNHGLTNYSISCDQPWFGDTLFKTTVERTISGLIDNVTSFERNNTFYTGGYYVATGEESYMVYQKVHGIVQCAPDIAPSECRNCLRDEASQLMDFCNGTLGATAMGVHCSVMYSLYAFYYSSNGTTNSSLHHDSSPPPSPPSQGNLSPTFCPGIVSAAVWVGTLLSSYRVLPYLRIH